MVVVQRLFRFHFPARFIFGMSPLSFAKEKLSKNILGKEEILLTKEENTIFSCTLITLIHSDIFSKKLRGLREGCSGRQFACNDTSHTSTPFVPSQHWASVMRHKWIVLEIGVALKEGVKEARWLMT
jgi:hypothetical protein